MRSACDSHTRRMRRACVENAPYPNPQRQLGTNPPEISAVVSALRKLRVTTDACGRKATSRQRSMTARSMS